MGKSFCNNNTSNFAINICEITHLLVRISSMVVMDILSPTFNIEGRSFCDSDKLSTNDICSSASLNAVSRSASAAK